LSGPLQGVKVVELGVWVAAPAAASILADWGADVVKIEAPAGDPLRAASAAVLPPGAGSNPHFEPDNRGKRSVALDLRSADEELLHTARPVCRSISASSSPPPTSAVRPPRATSHAG